MKSSLTVAPFFFIRRSSGSLTEFRRQRLQHLGLDLDAHRQLISDLLEDRQFEAALKHAAPQAWKNANDTVLHGASLRSTKKLVHALLRYYSRYCSRPTPYGAFGLVGTGVFCEGATFNPSIGRARIVAQTDYRCLENMMPTNAELVRHFPGLGVSINPEAIILNRTIHIVKTNSSSGAVERISITLTPLLSSICNDFISGGRQTLSDLVCLCVREAKCSTAEAERYIEQLLNVTLLRTDLDCDAGGQDPARYVIDKLGTPKSKKALRYVDALKTISDVARDITGFDNLDVKSLDKLCDFVEAEKITDPVLNVQYVDETSYRLPDSIRKEAETALRVMQSWRTASTGMRSLRKLHLAFLEKYGVDRLIPVKEMLDSNLGIGAPEHYLCPPSTMVADSKQTDAPKSENHKHIVQLLEAAWRNQDDEVELSGTVLDGSNFGKGAPACQIGAELFMSLNAETMDDICEGHFTLSCGFNPGNHMRFSSVGRFFSQMPDDIKTRVHEMCNSDFKGSLVDVRHLVRSNSARNLTNSPSPYPLTLHLDKVDESDNDTISVNDILIGADMTGFYALHRRTKEPLSFTSFNSVNLAYQGSNIARFLLELSLEHSRLWEPWNWSGIEGFCRYPRVRLGRIIFSPMTWELDRLRDLSSKLKIEDLRSWIQEWNVPRFCFAVSRDMRFLIDTEIDTWLEILAREIDRDPSLVLQELPNGAHDPVECFGWLRDDDSNFFTNEIVFEASASTVAKPKITAVNETATGSVKEYLPGEEWQTFHIYCEKQVMDSLLSKDIARFIRKLSNDGLLKYSFFTRYSDIKGSHLRLRMHATAGREHMLEGLATDFMRDLIEQGKIKEYVLAPYRPELERYGCVAREDLLHDCFDRQSRIALEAALVPLKRRFEFLHEEYLNCLFGLLWGLRGGFPTELELCKSSLELLEAIKIGGPNSAHYREDRKEWTSRALALADTTFVSFSAQKTTAYVTAGHHLATTMTSNVPLTRIVASYLHMCHNRIIGISPDDESRSLADLVSSLKAAVGRQLAFERQKS